MENSRENMDVDIRNLRLKYSMKSSGTWTQIQQGVF